MSYVTGVIDCRATGVPAHVTILHGYEGFLLARESVAEEELATGDGVGGGDFGGYHGCRWEVSSQIGWQNLPVPERDIVLVLVLSVGGEAATSSMGRQGSNKRYHCFGSRRDEG